MTARPGTRPSGDAGAALILVLIFTGVVAIVIVAVIGQQSIGFTFARTARDQARLQYGADAGLETAIRALQDDTARGVGTFPDGAHWCLSTLAGKAEMTAGEGALATATVNRVTVRLTCQTLRGALEPAPVDVEGSPASPVPGVRVIEVEATATLSDGRSLAEQAIVSIDNVDPYTTDLGAKTLRILSWRNRAG